MRNRDQRMQWIESLVGMTPIDDLKNYAITIPSEVDEVKYAVAFSSIVEILPSAVVRPLAFLPDDYCGVVYHGGTLSPIIDVSKATDVATHVAIVRECGCNLGILFSGLPQVIDLDKTERLSDRRERQESIEGRYSQFAEPRGVGESGEPLLLLTIEGLVNGLLVRE